MNNNEIENQINQDLEKFKNDVYKGEVAAPDNLLELFSKAVMNLPPQAHKVLANRIYSISQRKVAEIPIGELSDVIKIILSVKMSELYEESFDKAIKKHIRLEKFVLCYNNYVEEFQKKLRMKQANLTALSRGVPASSNGMRIIN